jgi:hypothetical protein
LGAGHLGDIQYWADVALGTVSVVASSGLYRQWEMVRCLILCSNLTQVDVHPAQATLPVDTAQFTVATNSALRVLRPGTTERLYHKSRIVSWAPRSLPVAPLAYVGRSQPD